LQSARQACFTPIPAKTTAKFSSPTSWDWFAICTASLLCGNPFPEKMGSFWPLIKVANTSMADMPVWMKFLGYILAMGFRGEPFTSLLREE